MQIKLQDGGWIALPGKLKRSLAAGPGSVFEVAQEGQGRLVLTRLFSPIRESQGAPTTACPIQ